MPVVHIEMLKGRTQEQKRAMVKEVTDCLTATINCRREAVKIIIREIEKGDIADGGILMSEQ